MLKISGKTEDGRLVVSGVFSFYETQGIHLSVIFDELNNRGMVPDWVALYLETWAVGMMPERVMSMLSESIYDAYGADYRDRVIQTLKTILPTPDDFGWKLKKKPKK